MTQYLLCYLYRLLFQINHTFCFVIFMPKQLDACDCGVYVCKYDLAVDRLHFLPITNKMINLSV